MRIGVISDVHGNLAALEAVLVAMRADGVETIWCLGDSSDWLPQSAPVLRLLRTEATVNLAGNHDYAVCERATAGQLAEFSDEALSTIAATRAALRAHGDLYRWLASLPAEAQVEACGETIHLVHGAPQDPVWQYLDTQTVAREALQQVPESVRLVFNGHTHVPFGWRQRAGQDGGFQLKVRRVEPELADGTIELVPGDRYLLCPGSVGLPRQLHAGHADDLRAQWGLLVLGEAGAADRFEWRQTEWDVAATLAAIDDFAVSDAAKSMLRRALGVKVPRGHRRRSSR